MRFSEGGIRGDGVCDKALGPSRGGYSERQRVSPPGLSGASVFDRTGYQATRQEADPCRVGRSSGTNQWRVLGSVHRPRAETAVVGRAVRAHDTVK